MSETSKNPPAFPAAQAYGPDSGMELRDYFAAKALQGLLASDPYMKAVRDTSKQLGMTGEEEAAVQPGVVARAAYRIADAMLKARAA